MTAVDPTAEHWHDGPEEFVDYGVAGGGWVPTKYLCRENHGAALDRAAEDVERLAEIIGPLFPERAKWSIQPYVGDIAAAVLASDWLRERDADLLDSLATDITAAINEWRDGNRDDRRRRQGLRQALEIVNARRGAL